MRLLVVLIAAFVVVAPAGASAQARISVVGGTLSPGSRGIAYVSNRGLGAACTGTVVASNVVLTAAHCVVDLDAGTISAPEGIDVRTGTVDSSDSVNSQTSGVLRVVVDPLFNTKALTNDAALLELATPTASLPLPLAGGDDLALLAPGAAAVAFGWGLLSGTDLDPPATLHYGVEYVQSAGFCGAHDRLFAANLEFCAIDPSGHVATCHGDSGGPMLAIRDDQSLVQIGIVSRGVEDCSPASPSVFTRVDALADWANSWIAVLAAPAPVATPVPAAPAAPVATATPTPTPAPVAKRIHVKARHAESWLTLSPDGGRITKARLAVRVTCRGNWYARFDNTWKTNAALAPGRAVTLRFPSWSNRYWTRVFERLRVSRSRDGSKLIVAPGVSARPRNHRLGLCRADNR